MMHTFCCCRDHAGPSYNKNGEKFFGPYDAIYFWKNIVMN